MVKYYTEEWNGFQFQSPTRLDDYFDPYRFALVKWEDIEPREVIDYYTGKKVISTRHCFVIGNLIWNHEKLDFDFENYCDRYLKYRVPRLEHFILDFCDKIRPELLREHFYE